MHEYTFYTTFTFSSRAASGTWTRIERVLADNPETARIMMESTIYGRISMVLALGSGVAIAKVYESENGRLIFQDDSTGPQYGSLRDTATAP